VLLGCAIVAHAQVAVVNPRITDAIDRPLLQRILLGQVTTWADGSPIVIILASDPASRTALEELAGRDLDRLLRGWKRLVFGGGGAMPTVVASAQQALTEVATHAGALAIVGAAPADPTQRVRALSQAK
jgi:hypothetical protein